MGNQRQGNFKIFRAALMITGTTIGIGILGLPIKTGLSGVLPSLVATSVVWVVMLGTGWILARGVIASNDRTIDISTLVHQKLGFSGRVMTVIGYLVLVYGIITAHLAGGGEVLSVITGGALSVNSAILVFFVVATVIALLGVAWVEKINSFLMAGLLLCFGVILFEATKSVDTARFAHKDWTFLSATIPIIVCAQAYQLIVPSVCRMLNNDAKAVKKALVTGTLIPVIINSLWMLAVVGVLPLAGEGDNTIFAAFEKGEPATVPLAAVLQSTVISRFALVFSMVVLVSSYVLQSTAVIGFFEDLLPESLGRKRRTTAIVMGFFPPLVVVFLYPGIFLKTLDLIGGGSVILLFGVIPGLILLKDEVSRRMSIRVLAICLVLVCLFFMGLELMQEFGLLKISPNVEYWF
ncbi:MAG: aromatic amino acid transport family protein [Pseudomonadota bacterium]